MDGAPRGADNAVCRPALGAARRPDPDPTPMTPSPVPSFRPLWQQIRTLIESDLASGAWKPGEAIPSEIELAARFRVSQGTVRRAIDALADDNLVIRRQGKGTYVATHTEERVSMPRFLRIRRDDGVDEYPGSRLIDVRRAKAGAEAARLLELKAGDAVLVLRRLLEFGGAPVVLDEITLPAALFRGLTRARIDAYRGSMYGLFESGFGVRMLKAREKLKAIAADADAAALLGVAPGTPLLAVERVTTTFGERPVELRRGLCTSAHHHYLNELG
ncbi:putative fructoselysine utilization operon transcriptional repressor [Rhizobiaceae bacterium]|nr:putative fructoselysine utilization operon transcriptional repressor [Rhizobiaceae bacterium]